MDGTKYRKIICYFFIQEQKCIYDKKNDDPSFQSMDFIGKYWDVFESNILSAYR